MASSLLIIPLIFVGLAFFLALLPFFWILKVVIFIARRFKTENIRDKVVLITGASSGIGEHLTYEYAKRGARLVIVARRENLLEKVAEKARQLGSPEVLHICADVLKVDGCRKFVEEAVNRFGRLDHLVNNAGILSRCFIEEATDITKFAPVMNVNFWGSVYPTFFAIPHLRKSKGSIFVNASSTAILNPPGLSIYSASKAALVSFYDAVRAELAPEISITVAILGAIESEMTQGKLLTADATVEVKSDLRNDYADYIPLMGASACAAAIVDAVCRREKYVMEPKWCRIPYLLKTLCPELIDWTYRILCRRHKTTPLASSENKLD